MLDRLEAMLAPSARLDSVFVAPRDLFDISLAIAFVVGGVVFTIISWLVSRWRNRRTISRAEKKVVKLMGMVHECVSWDSTGVNVLGLMPRLWIEALDKEHRYGALLYGYWSRWELSNTEENFFEWLQDGPGSLIDLPKYPRRLLDESKIIYLTKDQQRLFRVGILDGLFVWAADNTRVTLPAPPDAEGTEREKEIKNLLESRLIVGRRRDELLAKARSVVQLAIQQRDEPTEKRLAEIAEPLIREGLLCQLRDPYFSERIEADHRIRSDSEKDMIIWPTPAPNKNSFSHLEDSEDPFDDASPMARSKALRLPMPTTLRKGIDWDDFLKAIDHDQGKFMTKALPKPTDKSDGIFVIDKFGILHCATKYRGVFQHSSFVRGHCVKVAGGIAIQNGELKRLSPHSGHYQPMQQNFNEMRQEWEVRGVDFKDVRVEPFVKTG